MAKQKKSETSYFFVKVNDPRGIEVYECILRFREAHFSGAPHTKSDWCYYLNITRDEFDKKIKEFPQ